MVRIENWSAIRIPLDMYKPAELSPLQVRGLVYGHPKFANGDDIITSALVRSEGRVVCTRNTEYILGQVDPDYLEWYRLTHPDQPFDPENPFYIEEVGRGEGESQQGSGEGN